MSLSVLFSPLQSLLGTLQSERHYQDDKMDAALTAINKALIQTKQYIEKSEGTNCIDRSEEYNPSQLWSDAAAKARYASTELAQRLQNKSLYWAEDFRWSREEVLSKEIDIDSIQEQVVALLRK